MHGSRRALDKKSMIPLDGTRTLGLRLYILFIFPNINLEYVLIYTASFYVTLPSIYNTSSSCTGLARRF